MDTKFQTSFIPKKPIISDNKVSAKHATTSIFMFLTSIIFIISIAVAVYSVLWKNVLLSSQENYKSQLAASEKRFNTTLIEELKKVNVKLDLVKGLLKNHLAVSELFPILSRLTIEGVRFNSFDFGAPAKDSDPIKISMHGIANSFSAIAFQSDVFGQSQKYGSNKILKNPVLSDLILDANGNVGFTFSTVISPTDVLYEKVLNAELNP